VLFGPGTIRVAHKPDEHVPIADLVRAQEVLATLIAEHCGASIGLAGEART
jgi:succinyl-diaminopimelate desuccinylase